MKALKIFAIVVVAYVGIVVAFESLIGVIQPAGDTTLVITTTDSGGNTGERVVTQLQSNDQLYVAANHWPRAWYTLALEHPEVRVTINGETSERLAVPAQGAEHDRLQREAALPFAMRVVTGFPPRKFLRLDPR